MMHIEVSQAIEAPRSKVWGLLTYTDRWEEWSPFVSGVDSSRKRINRGTTGRIKTPVGVRVPFEVTEYESDEYWKWDVARIPATGHRLARASGKTVVAIEVPLYAAGSAPLCRRGLDNLCELAER